MLTTLAVAAGLAIGTVPTQPVQAAPVSAARAVLAKPTVPPTDGYNFELWFDGIFISMNFPWQWLDQGYSWTFGNARLAMQQDGNLVIYDTRTGRARWASNTFGSGANQLLFQDDGNLVLYRRDGRAVWATGTHDVCPNDASTLLGLQADSNLVIYCYRGYDDYWPIWASGTVF